MTNSIVFVKIAFTFCKMQEIRNMQKRYFKTVKILMQNYKDLFLLFFNGTGENFFDVVHSLEQGQSKFHSTINGAMAKKIASVP